MYQDYESKYQEDYHPVFGEDGRVTGFVYNRTGEYDDAEMRPIVPGSRIITPAQQERIRQHKERQREQEEKERAARKRKLSRKKGGHYFFMSAQSEYKELSPANTARLAYLATYMSYDDNTLKIRERTPMKKADLPSVLRLSASATRRFWKEASGNYINLDKEGTLYLSPEYFHRGQGAGAMYNWDSQTLFNEYVKALYEQTPPNRHCYLGRVFKMLPYVNREYNALCHNPLEPELDNVEFLTLGEFCEISGYSANQQSRLMREYKDIVFPVKGRMEQFCAFVTNGGDISTSKIFINPRVIYRGADYEAVRILGKFAEAPRALSTFQNME